MKFGVVMHKTTQNIGDDIQTYAAKCHLPQVDYFIDREQLDTFKTEDGKPVAVVMSAWYMWHKWHWPPSDQIVPLLTGIHYSDHGKSGRKEIPVQTEFLTGCGGEYMNANGPVGCRDAYTRNQFKALGINAFFSGCITLTLPKMEIRKPEKEYICAVDLPKDIMKKLRKEIKGSGIEIIKTHHHVDYRDGNATWEEREAAVKELLTIYQNAKCVVTRRLHCALPCLAMGVPVFVTNLYKRPHSGRFDPYYKWIHNCSYKEFLAGDFDYDFTDPPANDSGYLKYREAMIKSIDDFVARYKDEDGDPQQYVKTTYSKEELYEWRSSTMRGSMDNWLDVTIENDVLFREELQQKQEQIEQLTKELERKDKILNCRSVRSVIKLRNALVGKNKKIKL